MGDKSNKFDIYFDLGYINQQEEKVELGNLKSDQKSMFLGYGIPKFISHEALFDPNNECVVDNQLTVYCEVN